MKIVDFTGETIIIGTRVIGTDDVTVGGTVTSISDLDGDVDEDGRPYNINPKVYVMWDGELPVPDSEYDTTCTATGPWDEDAPFEASDEILVLDGA